MTTLYLVRHGQTDYNRRRIVQGRGIDAPLDATGQQQADAVARRFEGVPLDAVYSSSLTRAVQTAERVAAPHGLPVHRDADLDEMAWGALEGAHPSPELTATFAQFYDRWAEGRFEDRVEGGESILDVQRRGVAGVERIVARHAEERVLVVTHGRFLRVLLATLLDEYRLEQMQTLHHANTGVNHLEVIEGTFAAQVLNCTTHLNAFHEAA